MKNVVWEQKAAVNMVTSSTIHWKFLCFVCEGNPSDVLSGHHHSEEGSQQKGCGVAFASHKIFIIMFVSYCFQHTFILTTNKCESSCLPLI